MTLEFPLLGEKIAAAIQQSIGAHCMAHPSATAVEAQNAIEVVLSHEQHDELRACRRYNHFLNYSNAMREWTFFGVRVEIRSLPLNGFLRAKNSAQRAGGRAA